MPEYKVAVTKLGFDDVQKLFKDTQDRMKDLTPALKKGRLVMLRSVQQNFKAGGLPKRWAPLRPATVRFKARNGFSPLPLTRRGLLQASITGEIRGRDKLAIGTAIKYGRVHQKGGGNNIPARPYLVFKSEDIEDLNFLVVSHITGRRAF